MKKKGFTLIELLAVIIILGILMLIAIPSITHYIENSRKGSYINSIKEIIKGTSSLVNSGNLDINDSNTTYYIPYTCVSTESGKTKSPYGDFEEAYVVVTIDSDDLDYNFYGYDETGHGIAPITNFDELSPECIQGGIDDINTNIGLGKKKNIVVFSEDCTSIAEEKTATKRNKKSDKTATFDTGKVVNSKMKIMAGSTKGQSIAYLYEDRNITNIEFSLDEPTEENKQTINTVSSSNSETPIYMWFDETNGTMYWWSEDDEPQLNADSSYMFDYISQLPTIVGIENFDTSNVTDMSYMFCDCKGLQSLNLSNFDTSKVTNMEFMFYYCSSMVSIDLSEFDTSKVTNMHDMFMCMNYIESLDLSGFDTSSVTDMSGMFFQCHKMTQLNVTSFDTSKVTTMSSMFTFCSKLTQINISNFDTTKVTDMSWMFRNCEHLTSLNVSNFNTSKVTDMSGMFMSCYELPTINVSNFDTSKVTRMDAIFCYCEKIESLDLTSFNTSSLTVMGSTLTGENSYDTFGMFEECKNLKTINLSSFNTSNVTAVGRLFDNCIKLETVYVGNNFTLDNVTDTNKIVRIFRNCNKLVGGAGTTWNSSMESDKTYAKIDGGIDSPGLFTLKTD